MRETSPSLDLTSESDLAPKQARIKPPTSFSAAEKRIWRELVDANQHINSPAYATLTETYCRAVARCREMAAIIRKEGSFIESNKTGEMVPHPALKVLKSAEGTVASLVTKLAIASGSRREHGRDAKAKKAEPPKRQPKRKRGAPPLRIA